MNTNAQLVLRSSHALAVAAHEQDEFAALTKKQREAARYRLAVLRRLRPGETQAAAARRLAVALPTLSRWTMTFRRGGWRGLVPDWKNPGGLTKVAPAFVDFWRNLYESNQRKGAPAIRRLRAMWRAREPIPGFAGWPGWPNLPRAFSVSNLYRLAPAKVELVSFRVGRGAAAALLPQTFATRVGLWPGSHIQLDDMMGDFFVNVLDRYQAVRPLFLHALDCYTGCVPEWGARPRLRNFKKEKQDGLLERDTRLLVTALLFNHGYHAERGTMLMAEHGTAAVNERVEKILFDATDGKIRVRRSGMSGVEQAVAGLYPGDGGGNFKFKAMLESWHNLAHNEQAFWPGQTGMNLEHRPEHLAGTLNRNAALLQAHCKLPRERAEKLIFPLKEWRQFMYDNRELYRQINARTDHHLKDWAECGHLVSEFRLAPDSDCWLGAADFARLPAETQTVIRSLITGGAEGYTRARRLSPAEVWERGRRELTPLPVTALAEMLLPDLGKERKCEGSYFRFDDKEVSLDPLTYEAVIINAGGTQREAARGEKYMTLVNPFAPAQMHLFDAAGRYLGWCRQTTRATYDEVEKNQRQWGRNAAREKEIYQDMRIRRHAWSAAQAAERAHNNDVLEGVTPEDRAAARQEQDLHNRAVAATVMSNKQNNNNREAKHEYDEY
ncbi:MAG: helix-turn-helix domain-containing protein [Verrucomicrobiales bacterium]|jgi:hypothetical protein|nr:helix-turn-helix domain-containing protein [Verrucomicrobiales bacterium]